MLCEVQRLISINALTSKAVSSLTLRISLVQISGSQASVLCTSADCSNAVLSAETYKRNCTDQQGCFQLDS